MASRPKVSVIVRVGDHRASLDRSLGSVFDQTLAADAIEVVAVDDGSTDGSGRRLDRLAASRPGMRVVHQPASGGPGAPRNAGLQLATGEYVIFLEPEDRLGEDALARMTRLADFHGTDVVVGQCAGAGTREPRLARDFGYTTVLESPFLYDTLTPYKLFRMSLVDRLGLRFVEGMAAYEHHLFTARAYFGASGVSVLAGYDCYRFGEGVPRPQDVDEDSRCWPFIAEVMSFVGERLPPGPLRDTLMRRHFREEIFPRFGDRYLAASEIDRAIARHSAGRLVRDWYTPDVDAAFGPRSRLVACCLGRGLAAALDEITACGAEGDRPPAVVDKDRAYSAYPLFRDPAGGIPDEYYDVTDRLRLDARPDALGWHGDTLVVEGTAAISEIDLAEQRVNLLLLAEEDPSVEHRLPGRLDPTGRFTVEVGPAAWETLGPGRWKAYAEVRAQKIVHTRRLVFADPRPGAAARLGHEGTTVAARVDRRTRALSLDVTATRLPALLHVDEVGRAAAGRLGVVAHVPAALADGHPVHARAELVRRGTGECRWIPATTVRRTGRVEIDVKLDLRECGTGRWDPTLELVVGGVVLRARIPAPDEEPPGPVHLFPLRRARPYRTVRGGLSVEVRKAKTVERLGRALSHCRS
ncbi:glycosyltransferase family 2 protein [Thermomonospora umbrina]|uniref:Glycosyl transferase family 2 n=1 Tax=Thermomonospora umbrina TaxID=111806 RepID=A0A3D9SV61_9ACTN|nr:glycosyltransferase [Thermomonospora umbrina]REE98390.1 glycosyl transferase family 2 [Thermomonospora umbrina]